MRGEVTFIEYEVAMEVAMTEGQSLGRFSERSRRRKRATKANRNAFQKYFSCCLQP